MNIQNRRPRRSRFGSPREDSSREATIARLREQAPSLGGNRRLRSLALFGSAVMVMVVAGLYYALRIAEAAADPNTPSTTIEVDRAPEIPVSEIEKALQRIEQEQQQADRQYQEQLQQLQQIDLFNEEPPPAPQNGS